MNSQFVTGAITGEELAEIIGDVLSVLEAPQNATASSDDPEVAASVVIHGPQDLVLEVHCDPAAGAAVAQAFFGADASSDDRTDAMRELVNVCAGASKTMLEGEWTIGIPTDGSTVLTDDAIRAIVPMGLGRIQASLGAALQA